MISRQEIEQALHLEAEINDVDVFAFENVESTNQWVLDNLSTNKKIMCVSETQSGGRGRRGRHWQSPAGGNIYLSFSYSISSKQKNLSVISLIVGVALIRVLKRKGVDDVALKWPNDVLRSGRKVAGVLIEVKMIGKELILVVGIGINVIMPHSYEMPPEICWRDLSGTGVRLTDRADMIAMLYSECDELIKGFIREGFISVKDEWVNNDFYAGKEVNIIDQDKVLMTGIESGVDEDGCLLIKNNGEIKKVLSGDVSLRRSGFEA